MNRSTSVKDPTIRRVLAFFALISAILVAVAVQAARNISRSVATSDWVNHTHAVILEADGLRVALYLSDGALRTYALTSDARDFAACRTALANVGEQLEIVQALTRFEPAQHEEVVQIGSQVTQRSSSIQKILAAGPAGNPEAVRALLAADAGGTTLAAVQRKIEKLKNEELALLSERDNAAYLQAQTTRWTVWSGVALDVLLLGGVAWLIRDDLAARRRVTVALQEANEKLEARVLERTAELAAANERLSVENLERQWANQALEHQLRYNRLIVDSISDLVLVLTTTQKISRINPAVVHLTGMETTTLINQPLSRIVRLAPTDRDAEVPMIDPIAQALREGHELRDRPATVEDKRGRLTSMLLTVCPLRDRDKVVGGIVTLRFGPQAGEPKA